MVGGYHKFMRDKIKRIIKHPLFAGSFILTAGNFLGNVTNYLFHLITGRVLGPKDYAVLTSLISLTYFTGIFSTVILTTIMREIAKLWSRKKKAEAISFFKKSYWQVFILGMFINLVCYILSRPLATFLKIDNPNFIILAAFVSFVAFINIPNLAFTQALMNFKFLAGISVGGGILKIVFVFLLTLVGISIGKILGAIILSGAIILTISFIPFVLKNREGDKDGEIKEINIKGFWINSLPVFLAVLGMTSLYTSDIVLTKHYLSSFDAGLYSSASVLGKVIFFASSPILTVMMPLTIKKKEENTNYRKPLYLTLGFILLVCLFLALLYFTFPKTILFMLYGKKYLAAARYLGIFSIFISFYSLANVLTSFYMALEDKLIGYFPLGAALVQILLIKLFHQDIYQIIISSTSATAILVISLLIYSNFNNEKLR